MLDSQSKTSEQEQKKHTQAKIYAHADGVGAEGLACADPGARTSIGKRRTFFNVFQKLSQCSETLDMGS